MEEIWTQEQVDNLNKRQNTAMFHPYTCGCHSENLIPTIYGWKCPISQDIVQIFVLKQDLDNSFNLT